MNKDIYKSIYSIYLFFMPMELRSKKGTKLVTIDKSQSFLLSSLHTIRTYSSSALGSRDAGDVAASFSINLLVKIG